MNLLHNRIYTLVSNCGVRCRAPWTRADHYQAVTQQHWQQRQVPQCDPNGARSASQCPLQVLLLRLAGLLCWSRETCGWQALTRRNVKLYRPVRGSASRNWTVLATQGLSNCSNSSDLALHQLLGPMHEQCLDDVVVCAWHKVLIGIFCLCRRGCHPAACPIQ